MLKIEANTNCQTQEKETHDKLIEILVGGNLNIHIPHFPHMHTSLQTRQCSWASHFIPNRHLICVLTAIRQCAIQLCNNSIYNIYIFINVYNALFLYYFPTYLHLFILLYFHDYYFIFNFILTICMYSDLELHHFKAATVFSVFFVQWQ